MTVLAIIVAIIAVLAGSCVKGFALYWLWNDILIAVFGLALPAPTYWMATFIVLAITVLFSKTTNVKISK